MARIPVKAKILLWLYVYRGDVAIATIVLLVLLPKIGWHVYFYSKYGVRPPAVYRAPALPAGIDNTNRRASIRRRAV